MLVFLHKFNRAYYSEVSQPSPSLSRSKPCGSGGKTVKSRPSTSSQFKLGGGGGMQKSGYDVKSQLLEAFDG